MATSRASPALASHAEKASSRRGEVKKLIEENSSVHRERAKKRESIIPSRQRRAESRWVR